MKPTNWCSFLLTLLSRKSLLNPLKLVGGPCGPLFALIVAASLAPVCWGHGIVGDRMFIEPLFTEDANIKNEVDIPRLEFLTQSDGSFRMLDVTLEKELWPDRWSVVVEQARLSMHVNGRTMGGFDNLEVGMKLAAYRNAPHEFIVTPALFTTFATGSRSVVERQTALQPMLLYGKGFGDVKVNWVRPFAVQGDLGYGTSVTGTRDRQVIYDAVLEYSVPYLNWMHRANAGYEMEHQLRRGHSLGAIVGDLFPFVEFNGATPVRGTPGPTVTFLRPGALYMGKYFQLSLAADSPVNGYLGPHSTGGVILLDLFLDELHSAFGWTPFGKRHRQEENDHD